LPKEFKIKKLFVLFFILVSVTFASAGKYDPFIVKQIEYMERLNDDNITKDEIKEILVKQKDEYNTALENIMRNKQAFIDQKGVYDDEIFALERIIKINKRAGNKNAVLRDQIQVKTYKILNNQNNMIRGILTSLDEDDSSVFARKLNDYIARNQNDNASLVTQDYKEILDKETSSKSLKQAKINIREYYAVLDINIDVINYLYMSENKMYRLNKYSKYNLISAALFVNNIGLSKIINPILEEYGLSVVKLLVIAFLIVLIFVTKKVFYVALENYISKAEFTSKYSKDILSVMRTPLERLILVINIHMIVYVYNDFTSIEVVIKFFNMLYAGIVTFIIFRVINVVAKIKVHSIERENTQIKNDVINVGIKILNFIILILGLLVILHFAGANLTAVLSGLGIGGFAVALAAKDSLANFFGTLSILFSDVFSQGDWIIVDDKEGVVIEIGTRVTTLRTFDNALIAIPNAILANQGVKNWSKRNLGRRIKMNLAIKYGSSSQDIKNAINEIRAMLSMHEGIATDETSYQYSARESAKLVSREDALGIKKTLLVYLDEFADSSMNILVYCFTKSIDWQEWLETKEEVMHRIMEIFEKNDIEFAFPSLSLYQEENK
jgi:MscS family membrane protein